MRLLSSSTLLALSIALFGVLLPFAAIGLITGNDFLRDSPFNPIPNAVYILLVATIPVANAFVAVALWRGETALSRPLAWLHTLGIGVALAYTLHLAPLVPDALLFVFWWGLGLVPLAPLLALVASFLGRARLNGMPPLWAGMLIALAGLALADAPAIATRVGLKLALSESHTAQASGRYLLRHAGSDEVLRWTCESTLSSQLGAPGAYTLNALMPVSKEEARKVYYQVKGQRYYWLP